MLVGSIRVGDQVYVTEEAPAGDDVFLAGVAYRRSDGAARITETSNADDAFIEGFRVSRLGQLVCNITRNVVDEGTHQITVASFLVQDGYRNQVPAAGYGPSLQGPQGALSPPDIGGVLAKGVYCRDRENNGTLYDLMVTFDAAAPAPSEWNAIIITYEGTDYRCDRSDGTVFWCQNTGPLLYDKAGQVVPVEVAASEGLWVSRPMRLDIVAPRDAVVDPATGRSNVVLNMPNEADDYYYAGFRLATIGLRCTTSPTPPRARGFSDGFSNGFG